MNKEILWNLINAGLAGALVFLGACSSGSITYQSFIIATIASLTVVFTKFKEYWTTEEPEYRTKKSLKLFNFIN